MNEGSVMPGRQKRQRRGRCMSMQGPKGKWLAASRRWQWGLWTVLAAALLSGCATTGARPVPDTTVLGNIRESLETAEQSQRQSRGTEPSEEALEELVPGLSVSDEVLEPVEERFNVEAREQPAREFFNNLVAGTGYGVMVSPMVEGQISISLPDVTIDEVMEEVEQNYGYQITRNNNVYRVQPPGLETRIFTIDYLDVSRSGNSSVQVTSGGSRGGSGGGFGGGIGGGFGGVGGIGGIGGVGDVNQGTRRGVAGSNRPGTGGSFGGVGGGGAGGGGQVSTQTETDFWSDIQETLESIIGVDGDSGEGEDDNGVLASMGGGSGGSRSVVVQPQVGLVMVTGYPEDLERVESYIDTAQNVLGREVTIQVQFLEVVLNKGYQSAIDFDTFGPGGEENTDNTVTGDFSSGGDNGNDAISNPLAITTNFTDFNAVFRILESRGTTQVLSSPSLKVLNNQKAVFQDGDEEFFQTSAGSNVVSTGETVRESTDTNLEQFFSGISMDITPQIGAEGAITLHVHPTITTVNEQTKTISGEQVPLARTQVRELDSIIRAEDGRIVVLGGLANERSVDDAAGVPVANELPLIGGAFDQRRRDTVKSEFIILLRPMIADSESEQQLLRESNDRFSRINGELDPFFSPDDR